MEGVSFFKDNVCKEGYPYEDGCTLPAHIRVPPPLEVIRDVDQEDVFFYKAKGTLSLMTLEGISYLVVRKPCGERYGTDYDAYRFTNTDDRFEVSDHPIRFRYNSPFNKKRKCLTVLHTGGAAINDWETYSFEGGVIHLLNILAQDFDALYWVERGKRTRLLPLDMNMIYGILNKITMRIT